MRGLGPLLAASFLAAGVSAMASAGTVRVKLGLRERLGVERRAEPVTSGVPIPKGDLRDIGKVRLLKGRREVPAQFRVGGLWRPSEEIRWVLVDAQADLAANGEDEYVLEYGPRVSARARPAQEVRIGETREAYTVETGAATFRISRRRFTLFEEVKLAKGAAVVAPPADGEERGAVIRGFKATVTRAIPAPANKGTAHLIYVKPGAEAKAESWTLRFSSDKAFEVSGAKAGVIGTGESHKGFAAKGGEISIPANAWLAHARPRQGDVFTFSTVPAGSSAASEGIFESKVVERGPLRSVIRVKGSFGPASAPVMEYTAWYHFFAGSARVKLQFTLENNDFGGRTNTGNARNANIGGVNCVFFDEMALVLSLAGGAKEFSLLGEAESKAVTGKLEGEVSLYQDSSGGQRWNRYKNPKFHPRPGSYVTFKGYRIEKGAERLAEGGRAVGWMDVSGRGAGLTVTVRDFWQNFPKALSAKPGGPVQVGLFPGRYAGDFPFRSGEHKTHEMLFLFHGGDPGEAGCEAAARAFSDPLRLEPGPEWFARTKALGRLQPFDPEHYAAYEVRNLSAIGVYPEGSKKGPSILRRREEYDFHGWMDYGDVSMDFEGGTGQWGMKYDLDHQMVTQWARTGRPEWWQLFAAASRHQADIDIHHQPHYYSSFHFVVGGVWAHSLHGEPGHRNPNRNYNHFTKDLCFGARGTAAFHYLTGDWKTREACIEIATNALARYMSPQAKPDPAKSNRLGWRGDACTLNRLLEGYLMTGEEKFLERARWQIASCAFDGRPAKHRPTSLWSSVFYMMALQRYVEMFPDDQAARKYFLAHVETLRRSADPGKGIYYTVTPMPDGSVKGKGGCSHYNIMASDALAHAYLMTEDTKYMDAARACFAYGVKNACWKDGPPTYFQIHSANGATHGNVFMSTDSQLGGNR